MAKLDFTSSANALIKAVGKPRFMYGTAWKKTETARLVKEAFVAGFTAVDTAAQPRHYREDLVGDALRELYQEGTVEREDIFIQTKFTAPQGQDASNCPYDTSAPLATQIHTSLASSFHHLRTLSANSSSESTYIDSLVLHSPLPTPTLTLAAWRILESYVPTRIRALGISNASLADLVPLYAAAEVKPSVVQNRFYPATAWDRELRAWCARRGVVYQSFWTLTGNPGLLKGEAVRGVVERTGVGREEALYALVMGIGVTVLDGTTRAERMRGDLDGVRVVERWSGENGEEWEKLVEGFRREIGG